MSDRENPEGFECWVQVSGAVAEGWVFAEQEIEAIRASARGRTWPGDYGLPRPDVGLAFPAAAGAERSGFRVTLPKAAGAVRLEAKVAGKWRIFYCTDSDAAGDHLSWLQYLFARTRLCVTGKKGRTPARFKGLERGYICWIDQPLDWRRVSRRFELSGWCFLKSGEPIEGIRACVGEECYAGRHGLSRPDVVAVYGERRAVRQSGFSVDVELSQESVCLLRLEARHPDGDWRKIFTTEIRAARMRRDQTRTDALADRSYASWIKLFDTIGSADRAQIRKQIQAFELEPLFSIEMSLTDSSAEELEASLTSFREQLYRKWELVVLVSDPVEIRLRDVLFRFTKLDSRIRIGGEEVNQAGGFRARLQAGDALAPTALYFFAHEINLHPEVQLIYSDEDQFDAARRRTEPNCKPDWNPTLFQEQNYLGQLTVFRSDLVDLVGSREDSERADDDEASFRCVDKIEPAQIRHLPWVLYHRRPARAGGTGAVPSGLVRETRTTRRSSIQRPSRSNHVISTGRHSFDLPKDQLSVSIIIPTRDWVELLEPCVTSILEKTTYPYFEVLIVDNGSRERSALDYLAAISRDPRVRVLRGDEEFNYSRLNNVAVQGSTAEFVALVNNDIVAKTPEWLNEMVSRAMPEGVGAVGPRLLYPDGRIQQAGVILGAGQHGVAEVAHRGLPEGNPSYFGRANLAQELSAVGAACMLVRRSVYLEVEGFDEEHLKVAFNDIDFCLKLRERGYRVIYTPHAELFHLEHASRGHENTESKKQRFDAEIEYMKEKWGDALLSDPAYNPNLSLGKELFKLAFPPRVARPWREG